MISVIDIDECVVNPCNKQTENCQNLAGSHRCKCKKGYVRSKAGNCIKKSIGNNKNNKKKRKKKVKSEEERIEDDIRNGNFLSDSQLKLGSLLYAGLFGILLLLFKYERYYTMAALVLVYGVCLSYYNMKYARDWLPYLLERAPGRSFNFWDYFSHTVMQFFVFGLCNRWFSIEAFNRDFQCPLFRAGALFRVNTVCEITLCVKMTYQSDVVIMNCLFS